MLQKVLGNENKHIIQILIHLKVMKKILLARKENMIWLFLLGANEFIVLTVQDRMETETITELPDGHKKRMEWAAVVGLEDI